jgi:hypothetical protein
LNIEEWIEFVHKEWVKKAIAKAQRGSRSKEHEKRQQMG